MIPRLAIAAAPFMALLAAPALLPADAPARHRSPADLAVTPDGRYAVTANATADTASLVDLQEKALLAETRVGGRPFAVALSPDGRTAAVSGWLTDSVTILRLESRALTVSSTIPVGDEPRGVVFSKDGRSCFVALSGPGEVARIDLALRKVVATTSVGAEPWHVALTPDGDRLAVGNVRSRDVTVLDAQTLQVLHEVSVRGHNLRHLAVSPDGEWAYVPHISERGLPTTRENIDNGWVTASRISRIPVRKEGPREAISLDPRGKAVADVDGLDISPDGRMIAAAASGTHELLLLRHPLPFIDYGGPADHIEPDLLADAARFRRISLGGRPMGVRLIQNGKRAVVANYLLDSLQIVDTDRGEIAAQIPLGGPLEPDLARRGEALFYDARRSFNQWYSCSTCHVDGHTNGGSFDTFNDGSYGTPKKTLSLRGVAQTGPWTWHGAKADLRALVRDSMVHSMQGPEPADADLDAMMAFLKTLDFAPGAPVPDRTAVARGEAVFKAKGCDTCHAPPNYTSEGIYPVGLESPQDVHKGFNPPSLRGVRNRAPYLHTGEGRSLSEVLTRFHSPSRLTGKPDCAPQELKDLVAFLQSL